MLLKLLLLVSIACVVVIALLWWGQERVLFQPPAGVPQPDREVWRIEFAADDGTPLFAYLVQPPDSVPRPRRLVIHFHGNAETAAWVVPWADELARRSGAAVLVAEYRGYAGIPGNPTYATSSADARALWQVAQRELGATPERTVIHGFSLGSAIATELAAHVAPQALVLQAPFTSAREMAARMGPLIRGPVWRLVSRIHFDTRTRVAALDVPVWVAHGDRDGVIPVHMGREVLAAARNKGELLIVPRAGHNDLGNSGEFWTWIRAAVGVASEAGLYHDEVVHAPVANDGAPLR